MSKMDLLFNLSPLNTDIDIDETMESHTKSAFAENYLFESPIRSYTKEVNLLKDTLAC